MIRQTGVSQGEKRLRNNLEEEEEEVVTQVEVLQEDLKTAPQTPGTTTHFFLATTFHLVYLLQEVEVEVEVGTRCA